MEGHQTLMIALIAVMPFALYGLYAILVERRRWRKQIKRLEHENEWLQKGQERLNTAFLDLRGQRHDMLKHITALQFLMQEQKWEEAKQYMEGMVALYEGTNNALKGEHGHLAAFLLHTQAVAEAHGIQTVYDLDVPLSQLPLTMTDQSTLVGNLLSNALEAALESVKSQREARIRLSACMKSGLFILESSNSCLPIQGEVLDGMFQKEGVSTKSGNHEGLGTFLIGRLVQKYHGSLDYRYHQRTFNVKIKIPLLSVER